MQIATAVLLYLPCVSENSESTQTYALRADLKKQNKEKTQIAFITSINVCYTHN